MEKKYLVKGTFQGRNIEEIVFANSIKQAKLKGAFSSGYGGAKVGEFIRSKKIKATLRK